MKEKDGRFLGGVSKGESLLGLFFFALLPGLLFWFVWKGLELGGGGEEKGPAGRPSGGEGIRYRLDLNEASREALDLLPGIGKAMTERIVRYREEHGGFASVDDLAKIQGMSRELVEKIKPMVWVSSPQGRKK